MKILGISAFYHDSAAVVVEDGKIVAAAQEERFSRVKHDASFPIAAVKFCLEEVGCSIDELEAVVFYDKPLLKFERLLETYYAFAPRGLVSFVRSMPVWLREKLFLKRLILDELKSIEEIDIKNVHLLFPEHHLSHAASAFYPSGFQEAAILTIDGVGEWATASISHGKDGEIKVLKELNFPHSLGLLYSAFTYYLGFRVNSGEYKVMGLAPYGAKDGARVKKFEDLIKEHLVEIKEDGSIRLNQRYFGYATGLRMIREKRWVKLFDLSRRNTEEDLGQEHCDMALAVQNVTEEIVLKMAAEAKRITGSKNLCMAGGVALNCVANGKVLNEKLFDQIFIQPAAGDAGGALGAALVAYHTYYEKDRVYADNSDGMRGSYLGPGFSSKDIDKVSRKYAAVRTVFKNEDDLTGSVAQLLADGKVIGWFQGRMEFGPRALGNRSILGDPRSEEMQRRINLKIKYRESFRPFAPSVLSEDVAQYFQEDAASPYMLLTQPLVESRRKEVPKDFHELSLVEKLQTGLSDVPAITHVDFSARVQTVHKETNPKYWKLLNAFKLLTGYGLVVNTSFNVRGEPIVCSPEDAYRCFMRTEMDYLVINDCLFDKKEQSKWNNTDNWKVDFKMD